MQIPFDPARAPRRCTRPAAQRERIASEVAGTDQLGQPARHNAERLMLAARGQRAVEQPPRVTTPWPGWVRPVAGGLRQEPFI